MKTISINLVAVADSQADSLEAIDAEESQACAVAQSAAAKLVAELQATGVNIKTATATFAGREGAHGGSKTVDLTQADLAAPFAAPAPAPDGGE